MPPYRIIPSNEEPKTLTLWLLWMYSLIFLLYPASGGELDPKRLKHI